MTRSIPLFAASLLAVCLGPLSPAFAHAHLRSAQPPVNGTAHEAVQDLRITYSEAVEPKFCQIAVTGPNGQKVDTAAPQTDPADPKVLVVHFAQKLAPGAYHVTWHATSVDTHKTDGKYDFSVAP